MDNDIKGDEFTRLMELGVTTHPCDLSNSKDWTIIVDTDILLHHLPYLERLRLSHFNGAGPVNLFFPAKVLREAGMIRKSQDESMSKSALEAYNYIKSLLDCSPDKVYFQTTSMEEENTFPELRCDDDHILWSSMQLVNKGFVKMETLALFSNNDNLLLKGYICGLKVFDSEMLTISMDKDSSKEKGTSSDSRTSDLSELEQKDIKVEKLRALEEENKEMELKIARLRRESQINSRNLQRRSRNL